MLRKIEALLFVASEGINVNELVERVGIKESELLKLINMLQGEYAKRKSAIKIQKYPNGLLRMTVDNSLLADVSDLAPTEFSKALMKTLAIIAWKKGIKQSDVVKIRGNKSYDHIEKLLGMGFVSQKPYGNTKKLFLTNDFYKYFNIAKGEEKFLFNEKT